MSDILSEMSDTQASPLTKDFKIDLPEDVSFIINTIEKNGHQAYAVGGCVRDTIMGVTPNDWDITTNALPEEVKSYFTKTIDTGIQHGTVTVMLHSTGYEVTTYRIDGDYLDGRHPSSVEFSDRLTDDLCIICCCIPCYNDVTGFIFLSCNCSIAAPYRRLVIIVFKCLNCCFWILVFYSCICKCNNLNLIFNTRCKTTNLIAYSIYCVILIYLIVVKCLNKIAISIYLISTNSCIIL